MSGASGEQPADPTWPPSLAAEQWAMRRAEKIAGKEWGYADVCKAFDAGASQGTPKAEPPCAHCNGSGELTCLTGNGGPDDYEVPYDCPHCGGTGAQRPVEPASDLREALQQLLHEVEEAGLGDARDFNWPKAVADARAALAKVGTAIPSPSKKDGAA